MANYVTFPLNNTDYKAEDMQLWHSTRENGVFSANGELETKHKGGMTITVSTGRAWIGFSDFKGIIFGNLTEVDLTVDMADGSLDRKDYIVIKYDVIQNETYLYVKKGAFGSNPQPPALERNTSSSYELAIAEISIPHGAAELNQGLILDKRLDETVCGIMKDGVTSIPTASLQAQWEGWFNTNTDLYGQQFSDWFENVEDTLSDDVAGNLLNLINENTDEITKVIQISADEPTTHVENGLWLKEVNFGAKIYGLRYVDTGIDFAYTRLLDAIGKSINRSATKSIGNYTGRDVTSCFFDIGEKIFRNIKRVILDNDGEIEFTEGQAGFDDTLLTGILAPNTHSVMVQIPKFYYLIKYITSGYETYISDSPFNIDGVDAWIHQGFYRDRDGDNTAEIVDYRYFPAFEGVLWDNSAGKCITGNENADNTTNVDLNNDLICSFNTIGYDGNTDGLRPYGGLTIGENRSLCENRNTSTQKAWGQEDFNLLCAIQALYKVVFADFDSQSVLSKGFTKSTNTKPIGVGHSSVLNGKSGYVNVTKYYDGTSIPSVADNNGTESMSLFGIENFYGNIRKWIDGFTTTSTHHIGIWNKNFSSLSTTDLSSADKDVDMSSVWTTNIAGYMDTTWRDTDNADSKYLGDIIKTTGGSDSAYYADYASLRAGRVPSFSGYWRSGLNAGAFDFSVYYSIAYASSYIGGALSL